MPPGWPAGTRRCRDQLRASAAQPPGPACRHRAGQRDAGRRRVLPAAPPVAAFTAAMTIAAAQITVGRYRPSAARRRRPGADCHRRCHPSAALRAWPRTASAGLGDRVAGLPAGHGRGISRWAPVEDPAPRIWPGSPPVGLGGTALAAWVSVTPWPTLPARDYASLEDRAARAEAERDGQIRIAAAAQRASELQHRRARSSTRRRPGCAASSVTCTTGLRCGWPRGHDAGRDQGDLDIVLAGRGRLH